MRGTLFLLAGAAVLLAADFWEQKAPEEWTTEEVERILTDSPWAQSAEVRFVGERGDPSGGRSVPSIGLPGGRFPGSGRTTPSGQPDGGWGLPLATGGVSSRAFRDGDIVARWSSALPIRQALQLSGSSHIEERPELLKDYYVVSLSRIPPGMAPLADHPERLRTAARLTPKNQPAIRADRIEIQPRPGTPGIDLYFPRSAGLNVDDRQIVFDLIAEDYEVSAKFKPRDMVYRGTLEF